MSANTKTTRFFSKPLMKQTCLLYTSSSASAFSSGRGATYFTAPNRRSRDWNSSSARKNS